MNFQRKTLRLFYCDGDMHTSLRDQGSRTVFRVAGQSLAELRIGAVDSVSLLSVNNAGSVVGVAQESEWEQFDYTAYGHCSSLSAGPSSLGFNGEYYDNFLQGYMLGNGYRLFNGMRFNSPDSFAPFRVLNAYGYCDGDPINYTDPSGHMPAFLKGWFRPRGYNTSKQLMREMGGVVSSLEASVSRIDYHPKMGPPNAVAAPYQNTFDSSVKRLLTVQSQLGEIYRNNPDGFKRASNKIGYSALSGRALTVLESFESKFSSAFDRAKVRYSAWSGVHQERLAIGRINKPYEDQLHRINRSIDSLKNSYLGGKKDNYISYKELAKQAAHNYGIDKRIRVLEDRAAKIRESIKPLPQYPE